MTTTTAGTDLTRLRVAREVFRAFRQTRPFWGGLTMMLAGAEIAWLASSPIGLALSGGWSTSAGYLIGAALVAFGLVAWFAPVYAPLLGIAGVLVALLAFVSSNVGGFLLGTVLGIVGGAMTFGWGDKPAKRRREPGGRGA